jgi:hypothetical protein
MIIEKHLKDRKLEMDIFGSEAGPSSGSFELCSRRKIFDSLTNCHLLLHDVSYVGTFTLLINLLIDKSAVLNYQASCSVVVTMTKSCV